MPGLGVGGSRPSAAPPASRAPGSAVCILHIPPTRGAAGVTGSPAGVTSKLKTSPFVWSCFIYFFLGWFPSILSCKGGEGKPIKAATKALCWRSAMDPQHTGSLLWAVGVDPGGRFLLHVSSQGRLETVSELQEIHFPISLLFSLHL